MSPRTWTSKWDKTSEDEFNAEVTNMMKVPVMTAVHSDSWMRGLNRAIDTAERRHYFKQLDRLRTLRSAIGMARSGRKPA